MNHKYLNQVMSAVSILPVDFTYVEDKETGERSVMLVALLDDKVLNLAKVVEFCEESTFQDHYNELTWADFDADHPEPEAEAEASVDINGEDDAA